ncbi:MAG TPA: hypothetical protein PLP17_00720 [Oligoflexia bacterium]|nr:hypothetical protein [Oligoflexia bacterium]
MDHKESTETKTLDPSAFSGYPFPSSNTTYTPNQFFDVVLPHSSRGCVRLVAYMLRRTLGWSDKNGNPIEERLTFSYSELVQKAGIARSMIRSCLDEAESRHFIRCVQQGSPNELGVRGKSALYELCFDESGAYTINLAEFQGFFAGSGNRTYIPNAFFDHTVRTEPLAVVRVVGAIIRNTIGFQNKFGHRRQEIRLSFTDLQRITHISSRRTLAEALECAQAHNHITKLELGYFDNDAGRQSTKTLFGLRWEMKQAVQACAGAPSTVLTVEQESEFPSNGSKRIPENAQEPALKSKRTVRKGYRAEQFEKDTGNGSKTKPGTVRKGYRQESEKDTGIEITTKITDLNNSNKSQTIAQEDTKGSKVCAAAVQRLVLEGFDANTAEKLSKKHPAQVLIRQCELLPKRNPTKNRLGLLRKAIEEDWPAPGLQDTLPATPANPVRRIHRAERTTKHPLRPRQLEQLREKEQELRNSSPALYEEFLESEKLQRHKIERMPIVSRNTVQTILAAFDAPESKAKRLAEFMRRVAQESTKKRNQGELFLTKEIVPPETPSERT